MTRTHPAAASLLVLALLPLSTAQAEPTDYRIDPVHTRIAFLVSHAGFSRALGTFSGSHGTLHFDPDNWPASKVDVTIPIASLDLGDANWRQKVLDGTFFGVDKFPEAHFTSTRIEPIAPAEASTAASTHAHVFGTLTLHGQQQDVVLDVQLNAVKRQPLPPFHRTAGFSATATLSRKAFGMTAWQSLIGDDVQLIIEAEAERAKGSDAPPDQTAPAQDPIHADTK